MSFWAWSFGLRVAVELAEKSARDNTSPSPHTKIAVRGQAHERRRVGDSERRTKDNMPENRTVRV